MSSPIRFVAFAGRSSELEHLLARRAEAAKGRGGIVLVAGDPGIGKSRLVRELCERLPRRTTKIATGAFREFAQRPLAPLLDVLAQIGGDYDAGERAAAGSKAAFMAALVDAFERAARSSLTVIVLEDLHWADREALQVLHALSQSAGTRRLLFVATYRAAEIVPSHPNFSLIGRLLREGPVSLVSLAPLANKDIAELLRTAIAGKWQLSSTVLDGVQRRCDGNAFFAEELLRFAIDRFEAGDSIAASAMPLSLDAAVRDRLALCSPAAGTLLSQASLFGRRFDVSVVRSTFASTASSADAGSDPERELVRLGLIEVGESPGEYRFNHALVREIVYGELSPRDARELHHRIAVALAERPDAGRQAENLAHHFWHSGDLERAAPYCLAAGDGARALHAYVDASEWYERAAHAFVADADIARALTRAAQASVYADHIDRALGFYDDAKQRFARSGLVDDVVITSVLTAATMYDHGRTAEAAALLEDTRDRWSAPASPPVRDRMLLRLGFLYAFTRRIDAAWTCVRAVTIDAGAPTALAAERAFLESSLFAQGADPSRWRECFERAFALFDRPGTIADNRRVALSNAASQALALGETGSARDYGSRALEVARGIRSNVDHERMLLGQIELVCGNVAAARTYYEGTLPVDRFASRVERTVFEIWFSLLLGDEALARAPDSRIVTEAISGGHRAASVRLAAAFGQLAVRRGEEKRADTLFAHTAADIETVYGMTFAIAALALHRPLLCEGVRALVVRASDREHDRVNRALLALIDASQLRATDPPASSVFARTAAEGFAEVGWSWLEAQALELGGHRKEARAFYRKIDATAEIRRLERSTLTRTSVAPRDSVLTPREREVARIVASGGGNRATARELSISEKAVEKCLTSVYAKLGIATRAQLALFVAERGDSKFP